ncbi:MAG: NAD-dependent epimerase/dehydratase family protein [candidate division NC10 bacterium]|nr:NAD-dependent epimerase/dehydratase family protein [candidate division NC10 bacterium]
MTDPAPAEVPVLLTGATGFIGRHLLARLLRADRPVLALCRDSRALADLAHPRLRVRAGGLEDPECYRPFLTPEVHVMHLAAARGIPGITAQVLRQVNVTATLELARLAARAGVARFVYVSSAFVFGPSTGSPVDETRGVKSREAPTAYIRSRGEALEAMAALAEQGLGLVAVCPTIVFGPDHPRHPNRITGYIRSLVRHRLDLVVGTGSCVRNLVEVEDVVRGILQAEARGRPGEAYILGGEEVTHREFNRIVLDLAGAVPRLRASVPASLALLAARCADLLGRQEEGCGYGAALRVLTTDWRYSSRKAAGELGYSARPFAEGMRRTLEFLGIRP